jgi:hypothetical protein
MTAPGRSAPVRRRARYRSKAAVAIHSGTGHCSDLCLFRHLERVVNLDAKVSDCSLKFGVAQ